MRLYIINNVVLYFVWTNQIFTKHTMFTLCVVLSGVNQILTKHTMFALCVVLSCIRIYSFVEVLFSIDNSHVCNGDPEASDQYRPGTGT